MGAEMLTVAGSAVELDDDGFLRHSDEWSEAVAAALAAADGVNLESAHWLLLRLARDYYNRYHVAPGMRILVTLLRQHQSAADTAPQPIDSRLLYRLFPQSPARQVCRYAGLPKPVSCI
ncbi:MAG: TusE/DsrC/DsvC family sulfur relay protein [Wenzhouxiangellaceae bacterium]